MLFGVFVLGGGLSSCASSVNINQPLPAENAPSSTVSEAPTSNEFAAMEQAVHQQVNQYRQSLNLSPLSLDSRISQQARLHSQAMAKGQVPFSHNGFEGRVKAIGQSIPFRTAAENVAYNMGYSDPVRQAVQGWIESPGHRKNMEGKFDLTGIGVTKNAKGEYYLTQLFFKRR